VVRWGRSIRRQRDSSDGVIGQSSLVSGTSSRKSLGEAESLSAIWLGPDQERYPNQSTLYDSTAA
jgi:hypothetical protein